MNSMKKIIDKLFPGEPTKAPERIIIIISFLLSIVGVLLSGLSYTNSLTYGWSVLKDLVIFGTLLFLTLLFYVRYIKVSIIRQNTETALKDQITNSETALKDQITIVKKLLYKQTGLYNTLIANIKSIQYKKLKNDIYPYRFDYRTPGLNEDLESHLNMVTDYLIRILNNQLTVNETLPNEILSISVKALVTGSMIKNLLLDQSNSVLNAIEDKELYVITLERDPHTKNTGKREVKMKFYSVWKNTAFSSIYYASSERSDGKLINNRDFFLNNNLQELEEKAGYKNQSENWKDHYNACLVVPIFRDANSENKSDIYGFLTVDCQNRENRNILTEENTLPILLFGAELLAMIFLNLDLFDILQTSKNSKNLPASIQY